MKSGKTRILMLASGGGGVPLAGAYANRIVSMAKGLSRREDVSIKLWFVFLGNHNLQSQEGIYEGIPYEYMVDPEFKRNRVTTPFVHLYGMLKAACLIAFRKKEFDVAIAFFHSLLSIPVWLAARITGLPIIRELNEFPASIQDSGEERCSLVKHLFDKLSLMPFVGFISITNRLGRYLNELFPSKPIIIVPINVQPERFSAIQAQRSNYITYAGAISNQKDGIGYLITAFAIIAKTHPDLRMKLVGGYTSEEDENIVVELIRKYSLEELIELTGWVTRDEAAKHILQSLVLVLPRPDSIQASGGFPTKLGEYLATGIPSVVTWVGEIPDFLEDGISAFICPPNNANMLAASIMKVIDDYDAALVVAERGKQVALDKFDYIKQANDIIPFLKQFIRV